MNKNLDIVLAAALSVVSVLLFVASALAFDAGHPVAFFGLFAGSLGMVLGVAHLSARR